MNKGPIIQANAVMFLRARHLASDGRDHESEERDIACQRWLCRDAAAQFGATIVKEYVEYGGTGPIARRPIMRHMTCDLRTLLGVRYILVVGLDRLARTPEVLQELEQEVQTAGARFVDVSGLPVAYHCNPDEAEWYPALPLD